MSEIVYPNRELDDAQRLLSLLGSHWRVHYDDQQQVLSYTEGLVLLERQKEQDLAETTATVSRLTVPASHTRRWLPLSFLESERNTTEAALLLYGDDAIYGTDPETGRAWFYGVPSSDLSVFPLPEDVLSLTSIFNRMTDPSLSLLHGVDFFLRPGAIIFRNNPFTDTRVSSRLVYADGVLVDREIQLWGFMAGINRHYVHEHVGYILGPPLPETAAALDFCNAVTDGVVEGPSELRARQLVAAVVDLPLVRQTQELVLHVVRDARHLLVITDLEVYRFPLSATALVAAGDTVRQGDSLVTALQFYDLRRGEVPEAVKAITLGQGFLPPGYFGELIFENRDDAEIRVDTTGIFTRVEFELGGWPGDIERFWDDFHSRGVTSPPTLAQLLDERDEKVGEPGEESLPETINPMRFLIENVLRYNAFLVVIRFRDQGPNSLSAVNLRQLRRLVPPEKTWLIIGELEIAPEIVTMNGPGNSESAGYSESPVLGHGLEPIEETIDGTALISESPQLNYVGGLCI